MSVSAGRRLFLFAAVAALLMAGLRLFILLRFGQLPAAAYVPGVALSFPAEFLAGLLAAGLLLSFCGGAPCRALVLAAMICVAAVKLAAFHYEAVFDRLPALQLLFYLDELDGLSASLARHVPPAFLLGELALAAAVPILLWRRLGAQRAPLPQPGHAGAAGLVLAILCAVTVNAIGARLPDALRSGSREPLLALIQSAFVRESYDLDQLRLTEGDFVRFLQLQGDAQPGPVLDPRFPVCRLRPAAGSGAAPGRSLIILILESVGRQELKERFRNRQLMPNLDRMAQENFTFTRAHAPGIKSIQTLTALFSALPPNPFNYYLWQTPLPVLDGWPAQLRARGYDTGYFHGGDLSFERQRPYLEAAGFASLYELDAADSTHVHGWGHDDATMFRRLRGWVDDRGAAPYLATLFTLSTHDPYIVPPEWPGVFSPVPRQLREPGKCCAVIGEPDTSAALAETYRFLDAQVGDFYAWYQGLNPRPLLLVLGDHAPYVVKQGSVARDARLRFDIPVLLAGLDAAEQARLAPFRDELLSVHDLPLVLARVLGLPAHPCFMGPDLMAGVRGPEVHYAVGPESLQFVHLWRGDREFVLDRAGGGITALDTAGAEVPGADTGWVKDFTAATFPIHYYLMQQDAWFPRRGVAGAMTVLPAVVAPLFAAHRANVDGSRATDLENSRVALDRAAASAIGWLEIDLQLTADAVPVLAHDATLPGDPAVPIAALTLQELRARPGGADLLTLAEVLRDYLPHKKLLIELKSQPRLQDQQQLLLAVADELSRHDVRGRVIIDSFNEYLASSIKQRCDCEVGLDTPYRRTLSDTDLAHVRTLGLDWVYVEHTAVNADLVRRAHALGLKVMAYTVNDGAVIEGWRRHGELPDGIITDHVALAAGF